MPAADVVPARFGSDQAPRIFNASGSQRFCGMVLPGNGWPVCGSMTADGNTPVRMVASGTDTTPDCENERWKPSYEPK